MPHKNDEDQEVGPLPFWSGTITFGLVSVPVDMFPAVQTRRVSSRTFGPEGEQLARRYFSEDGILLSDADVVRGYELDSGRFIVITDDELDKLEPRKSRDIDLRRFVKRDEIPFSMFERHYVLAPGGESVKAYHLLALAMERDELAGIATYVMRGREYLVAIYAETGLLFGANLRFVDELRTPKMIGLPKVLAAEPSDLRKVRSAVKALTARSLDTKLFQDDEEEALKKLAKRKHTQSQDVIEIGAGDDDESEREDVVDIMSILKQRMKGEKA
ncbi:MAG TPA: hypothetical protein PK819_03925 [Thermomicrobiales bacterium]|nr:hypothetical protein [Thermomicrobiales bacterium]